MLLSCTMTREDFEQSKGFSGEGSGKKKSEEEEADTEEGGGT